MKWCVYLILEKLIYIHVILDSLSTTYIHDAKGFMVPYLYSCEKS